jgi:hypothetical protein
MLTFKKMITTPIPKENIMSTTVELPAEFFPIRDAVIEHVISGSPIPSDLSLITEWLGNEGYQVLISSWDKNGEDICIEIKHLADKFSDEMMHDYADIEAGVTITDDMRIDHIKYMCNYFFIEELCWPVLTIHSYKVTRDDGQSAIIGYLMGVYGQGGPEFEYYGIFADKESFYKKLKEDSYLINDIDSFEIAKILSTWK